jgi:hypothetical protein
MKNNAENKTKKVAGLALAAAILGINGLLIGLSFSSPAVKVYAEEEESERDWVDKSGSFSVQTENQEDGARSKGANDTSFGVSNIGGIVLVGTIAVILGVGGYAGYKLLKIRQKSIEIKSKLHTTDKNQAGK